MKHFDFRLAAVVALALPLATLANITDATATLSTNTALNLDKNTTAASGGDILWTGSAITFQGSAKGGNLGNIGSAGYGALTQSTLTSLTSFAGTTPIPSGSLVAGDVFGVATNGGNLAKVLVISNSGGSLALQFTTYGATGGSGGGPGVPTIQDVQNNSSTIPDGFPNSGVSPSTLFVIHGSNMADPNAPLQLQDVTNTPLPTTLNGASLTVTVNGTTTHPPIYYTSPAQIAAVLPAATPAGSGTITVTYNGATSAPATIHVVPSAYGIDVYNGNTAVAQDAVSGALITPAASGKPGQIITIWGTGLGADTADSDTTYTTSPHSIGAPPQVYIGGVQAAVRYSGASVYPGVHIIQITIPQGVPNGCYVPVAILSGSVISNTPTLAIMDNGGACSDAVFGTSGSQTGTQGPMRTGTVSVGQLAEATSGTFNFASASFQSTSGGATSSSSGGSVSVGTCALTQTVSGNTSGVTSTPLDAGTLSLQGPAGNYSLMQISKGLYEAQLDASAIPSTGGAFVFSATGGADVKAFSTTVTLPNPLLTWTNQSAAAAINRAQGLQVTWSGGAPGTYVFISGNSTGSGVTGSFFCYAQQSALQFTVPPYILAALPAGTGDVVLENVTQYSPFQAGGLDFGFGFGFTGISANSTWQ